MHWPVVWHFVFGILLPFRQLQENEKYIQSRGGQNPRLCPRDGRDASGPLQSKGVAIMNSTLNFDFVSCLIILHWITWWRHEMEIFSALLALCVVNPPVTGGFPSLRLVGRGALMISLICSWTNGLVNNRDADGLRRHRAHYDVTIMISYVCCIADAGHSQFHPP